jgi:hypothetical protein
VIEGIERDSSTVIRQDDQQMDGTKIMGSSGVQGLVFSPRRASLGRILRCKIIGGISGILKR